MKTMEQRRRAVISAGLEAVWEPPGRFPTSARSPGIRGSHGLLHSAGPAPRLPLPPLILLPGSLQKQVFVFFLFPPPSPGDCCINTLLLGSLKASFHLAAQEMQARQIRPCVLTVDFLRRASPSGPRFSCQKLSICPVYLIC